MLVPDEEPLVDEFGDPELVESLSLPPPLTLMSGDSQMVGGSRGAEGLKGDRGRIEAAEAAAEDDCCTCCTSCAACWLKRRPAWRASRDSC